MSRPSARWESGERIGENFEGRGRGKGEPWAGGGMGAWRTRKVRGRLMSQDRKKRNSLLVLAAAAALVLLMPAVAATAAAMAGRTAGE